MSTQSNHTNPDPANARQTHVIEVTESNFEELIGASTPTIVDFWAPWCGPCRALGPTIEELASDLKDQATVGKLNVDDHPALASRYGVSSIPAVMIFQNGEVVQTLVGLRPKSAYLEAIKT